MVINEEMKGKFTETALKIQRDTKTNYAYRIQTLVCLVIEAQRVINKLKKNNRKRKIKTQKMNLTIGRNDEAFEEVTFSIKIMLPRKRSIVFAIHKPSTVEKLLEKLKQRK